MATAYRLNHKKKRSSRYYFACYHLWGPKDQGFYGNIGEQVNVSPFVAPGNICCGSKNVSEFVRNSLLPQQNVSSFARRGNISATMLPRLRAPYHVTLVNPFTPKSDAYRFYSV